MMLILFQLLELLLLAGLLVFKGVSLCINLFIILAIINVIACYFAYRYHNIDLLSIASSLLILNIGVSYQIYYNPLIINKLSVILIIILILTLLFICFYSKIKRIVLIIFFHQKFKCYLLVLISLIFIILLIFGKSTSDNTTNWIYFSIFSFQLTEFIKPLVIAFLISLLVNQYDDIKQLSNYFLLLNIILILGFGLIGELGTLVVIGLYELLFFFLFARSLCINIIKTLLSNKYVFITILLFILFIIIISLLHIDILIFNKISNRILSFLNPSEYAKTAAYQIIRAKEALALSTPFGLNYKITLIAGHTDLAFVGLCLHFGIIIAFLIILAYQYLIFDSFRIIKQNISISSIIYFSCYYFFAFSSILMILINLGVLPMMGITINLLSYGGTAYLFSFIYLTLAQIIRRDLDVVQN